jgi:hypothetical protein
VNHSSIFERSGRADRVSSLGYFPAIVLFPIFPCIPSPPHFFRPLPNGCLGWELVSPWLLVALLGPAHIVRLGRGVLLLFSWLLFFVRLTLSALFGCFVALTLCVLSSGSHCPLVMVVACVSFAAHIVRLGFSPGSHCPAWVLRPARIVRLGWFPNGCSHAPRGGTVDSLYSFLSCCCCASFS